MDRPQTGLNHPRGQSVTADGTLYTLVGNKVGLVGQVVGQFRALITEGQLSPGERLPSQRELAARLGVSLTVVREAMQHLQAAGFLETKRGAGTTVRKVTHERIVDALDLVMQADGKRIEFEDLHLVRTVLETEIAAIAAHHVTRDWIERLERIVEETELEAGNPARVSQLDVAFHETLARMTGNDLLATLMGSIMQMTGEYFRVINEHLDARKDICPFHRKILEQVASGSDRGARGAMKRHLEQAWRNHDKVMRDLLKRPL